MIAQSFEGYGLKIAADVGGDPGDPAVVFLHGGGQTRHSWRAAAAALVASGHYVVSLDLRGHGASEWAADGDYSLDALVEDLYAVLRQLPTKPTLVGASVGGLVALTAIGESRCRIATALVLVDVTPRIDPIGENRVREFMQAHVDGFASLEEAADAVAAFNPHRPRPADPSGLLRNLRLREDGRYYWHWDPDLFTSLDASPSQQGERYEAAARRVRCPTLLVRGTRSELVDEESVQHFLDLIPSAEYADVSGAGHMVAGDRNDAFNEAVLAFLGRRIALGQPT